MIGLLIQDNAYEQDIRELLMSFYPGETYAHEVKEGVDFYVQTRLEDGEAVIGIWEKLENGEELEGWTLTAHSTGKADLSDHSATKNVIKKLFYQMLVKRTGHELPWGSLTGIRPTKIALSRLEDGWKEEDIRKFMKETYMTSDEKINLSIEIAAREKRLLEPLDYDRGYSLYVSIPFCPTTCLYCSFTGLQGTVAYLRFLRGLQQGIGLRFPHGGFGCFFLFPFGLSFFPFLQLLHFTGYLVRFVLLFDVVQGLFEFIQFLAYVAGLFFFSLAVFNSITALID